MGLSCFSRRTACPSCALALRNPAEAFNLAQNWVQNPRLATVDANEGVISKDKADSC